MAKVFRDAYNSLKPSNKNSAGNTTNGNTVVQFETAPKGKLFPQTDPVVDGEDCIHDCDSCTVRYPSKFSIDETDELYGHVNGWETHLIVATGKSDWVRDVADEKGSIMEAVDKGETKPMNGKLMLSASNMPIPESKNDEISTTVLLLPAFVFVDNVTPKVVPELIDKIINLAPTNTTPLSHELQLPSIVESEIEPGSHLNLRNCPHRYLILLCSQKTRDARCGQSAPLLRREFEHHLRPLGLYRDLHDERPGGVGIYFISHMGGHKYSANCFIYRRQAGSGRTLETPDPLKDTPTEVQEAVQCIWLARLRPEHCENIVKYTILQGKVVKSDKQLRGGYDRSRQLVSW